MANINKVNTSLTGQTGTGSFVGSNSPTFTTPTLGAASATSLSFSSTSEIIGTTTNNNAAAGSVGEFISSVIASPGSGITTATTTNVTTISLTAGDWTVWGNVGFTGNATTQLTFLGGWTSSTSATLPNPALYSSLSYNSAYTYVPFGQGSVNFVVPQRRYSLSGTTTIYLTIHALFTVSTCNAYGAIYARRMR
jgi:hypothetical protein